MDVKKIVEFDIGIKWKRIGGDNPYAMVFSANRIWRFSQDEDTKKYTYMKLLIQDNAEEFRWGLHKQKKIMIFKHKKFIYFMAPPNSRTTLIDYCKRRLGDPVLEINVDEDQIEDRIDEALQYYQEYHSDATVRTYLKHLVTSTDITNEYIPIASNILFVSKVLKIALKLHYYNFLKPIND